MRCLQIIDGDIVLNGGAAASVVGHDKLLQDLRMWLLEPFGTGFNTPSFGSRLNRMIGDEQREKSVMDAEAEVLRVISNYQANQLQRVKQARQDGLLYIYNRSEILNVIKSVKARAIWDRIEVLAVVSNGNKIDLSIPIAVSPDNVRV